MFLSSIEEIPSGAAGLRVKMDRMRDLVEASKRDANFRETITSRVSDLAPRDHDGEINRVVSLVRSGIRYVRDPAGVETFTDPRVLWGAIAGGRRQATGDCDDHVLAASAALETLGYPTRYAVGGPGPGQYRHVWLEVAHPRKGWLPIELTRPFPVGYDPGARFPYVEHHLGAARLPSPAPPPILARAFDRGASMSRISALQSYAFGGPQYRFYTPGDIMRMSNLGGMTAKQIVRYHKTAQGRRAFARRMARNSPRRIATNPGFTPFAVRSPRLQARLEQQAESARERYSEFAWNRLSGPPARFQTTGYGFRRRESFRRGLGDADELAGFFSGISKAYKKATAPITKIAQKIVPKPVQQAFAPVQKIINKVPGAGLIPFMVPVSGLAIGSNTSALVPTGAVNAPIMLPSAVLATKPIQKLAKDAPIAAAIAVGTPLIAGGGAGLFTGAAGITGAVMDGAGGGGSAGGAIQPGSPDVGVASMGMGRVAWLAFGFAGVAFYAISQRLKQRRRSA